MRRRRFLMAEKDRDPEVKALQEVYAALKALDVETRNRVLASVLALLGMHDVPPAVRHQPERQPEGSRLPGTGGTPATQRPVSLIELVQEKKPTTNVQRIALYAYYREKHEG